MNMFILAIIFLSSFAISAESSAEEVVICNECNSEFYFENLAETYTSGTEILIINPSSGEARKYKIIYERNDGKILIPRAVPQAVYDAINEYQAYEQHLQSFLYKKKYKNNFYINTISNSTLPNGCGAEDGVNIPDLIFTES